MLSGRLEQPKGDYVVTRVCRCSAFAPSYISFNITSSEKASAEKGAGKRNSTIAQEPKFELNN